MEKKKKWYVERAAKRQGPFRNREVREMVRKGEILPTDLLWKEGMTRPLPAMNFSKLFRRVGVRRCDGPSLRYVGLAGVLALFGILLSPVSNLVQSITGTAFIACAAFSFACLCGALVTFVVGIIGGQSDPTVVPTEGRLVTTRCEDNEKDRDASQAPKQVQEERESTSNGLGMEAKASGGHLGKTESSTNLADLSGQRFGPHVFTSPVWLVAGAGCVVTAVLLGWWLFAPTVPWVAISGTVAFQGQRLTEGRVMLWDTKSERCYSSTISPGGQFAFEASGKAGLQPGQYRISVHPPPPRVEMDKEMGRMTVHTEKFDRIPERYRDVATSGWLVDILPRGGTVMDLEMQ